MEKLIVANEQDLLDEYPCLDLVRDMRSGNIKWVRDGIMYAGSLDCPRGSAFAFDRPPLELVPLKFEHSPAPAMGDQIRYSYYSERIL